MAPDALGGVKIVLTTLTSAFCASPIPGASVIPAAALQVIGIAEAVRKNKEDARDLADYIGRLAEAITRTLQDKRPDVISQQLIEQLDVLHVEIDRVKADMEKLVSRKSWRCWIGYSDDTLKISGFTARIQTVLNVFQLDANLRLLLQVGQIKDGMQEQEIQRLIDRLGTGDNGAKDGAMDERDRTCLEGTRTPVLDRLRRWIEDMTLECKRIFWLTGVAGSGKSTVAATIVLREAAYKRLAASFYFSRAQPDRNSRVFLELARKLASWRGGFLRPAIAQAVKDELDIAHSTPANQFEKLIRRPLQTLPSSITTALIVLDALDECEEKLASKIVELIGNSHSTLPPAVRFLITSRAERHLEDSFKSSTLKQTLDRHSLDAEDPTHVANDIEAVLKERLPSLVRNLVDEPFDWPGPARRKLLVEKSNGLFIWITTVMLFIADRNVDNPEEQISVILSLYTGLDSLYRTVLVRSFPVETSTSLQSILLDVLGVIVTARVPVDLHTIASLLDPNTPEALLNVRKVTNIISRLQSVLVVPSGIHSTANKNTIRIIHPSFADFITDSARCGPDFIINVDERHQQLARGTLVRLRELKRDICEIGDSSKLNDEIDDLSGRLQQHVPSGLLYACQHWPAHVSRTQTRDGKGLYSLVQELVEQRLMYWMELLSLLGMAKNMPPLLEVVYGWLERFGHTLPEQAALLELTQDSRRFALEFMTVINASALHIYQSALPFAPTETALYRVYKHLAVDAVKVMTGFDKTWSNCLWIGEGHGGPVQCLALCPDGLVIASGSHDKTLRLWDATTGTKTGEPLHGHTDVVTCVAFSPNGKMIASGSWDCTLRLWDVATRNAIEDPISGHSGPVRCLAFSPDGKVIASGSHDETLRLWDVATGTNIGEPFHGHAQAVLDLSFSPNGKTIASAMGDHTLRMWDAATGSAIGPPLQGHTSPVMCLAFSPDGKVIASGSQDMTLRLWDATTMTQIGEPLYGHTRDVLDLSFSPDGKTIASGSWDYTLRLWDAATGKAIGAAISGHMGPVRCLAFSPDGKGIVSGANDKTLRLWDAAVRPPIGDPPLGHTVLVTCVAFSPDGKVIVLGLLDKRIWRWDAATATAIGAPLQGHTGPVWCLAFSPDGRVIASGSYDNTVRFWDVANGAAIGEPLLGHRETVLGVAFSPDGNMIASGSDDRTVRLWDATTRIAIGEPLVGHSQSIDYVSFLSNEVLMSQAGSDEVMYWDIDTRTGLSQPQEPIPAASVILDSSGWIRNGHGQRLFWVPVNFRSTGTPVMSGNRLVLLKCRVSILDISHFTSQSLL